MVMRRIRKQSGGLFSRRLARRQAQGSRAPEGPVWVVGAAGVSDCRGRSEDCPLPVAAGTLCSQPGQGAVERTKPAPAVEPVADRLLRAMAGRNIPPAQAVADHGQYAAQFPPVVHPRNPLAQRKTRPDPPHSLRRPLPKISQGRTCCRLESSRTIQFRNLTASEPGCRLSGAPGGFGCARAGSRDGDVAAGPPSAATSRPRPAAARAARQVPVRR